MITLIVGLLLVIFFFVALYMSAQTWRGMHLTALAFVFVTGLAFLVLASLSLKTRSIWLKDHDEWAARLVAAQQESKQLLVGDLLEVAIEETVPSVRGSDAALLRQVIDRGRVWRGCERVSIDPARGTVELLVTPTEDEETELGDGAVPPATEPAPVAAAPTSAIPEQSVLFAFRERRVAIDEKGIPHKRDESDTPFHQISAPAIFLGEFLVVATDPVSSTITVTPTVPLLDKKMQAEIAQEGFWTLYEQVPLDSHYAFATGERSNDSRFGETVESQLQTWFSGVRAAYEDMQKTDDYGDLIGTYLRDGRRPIKGDPPEHVWREVTFLKRHEVEVDSARVENQPPLTLGENYFDAEGMAKVDTLRRGGTGAAEKVVFEPGDAGMFPIEEARQLADRGICELKDRIYYVRPLRDYAHAYHENFRRRVELDEHRRTVQTNINALTEAEKNVQKQIGVREVEKGKLGEDLAKSKVELDQITGYADELKAKVDEVKGRLSELYRTNHALAEELAELHQKVADELDALDGQTVGARSL